MRHAGAAKQYIYRNQAVALPTWKGTERYGRDGWELEPLIERDAVPSRASGVSRNSTGKTIPNLPAKPAVKKKPGVQQRYTPEQCPMQRELYVRIGVEPTPSGMSFRVLGQCSGAWCGGRKRTFSINEWCELKQRGCTKCVAQIRRQERAAARKARLAVINS